MIVRSLQILLFCIFRVVGKQRRGQQVTGRDVWNVGTGARD